MCYCDGRRSAVMAIIYKREPKEKFEKKDANAIFSPPHLSVIERVTLAPCRRAVFLCKKLQHGIVYDVSCAVMVNGS